MFLTFPIFSFKVYFWNKEMQCTQFRWYLDGVLVGTELWTLRSCQQCLEWWVSFSKLILRNRRNVLEKMHLLTQFVRMQDDDQGRYARTCKLIHCLLMLTNFKLDLLGCLFFSFATTKFWKQKFYHFLFR